MRDERRKKGSRLRRRLETPGLSERQTRVLNVTLGLLLVLFTAGWGVALTGASRGDAPLELGRQLTASPLNPETAPPVSYLLDRVLRRAVDRGPWQGRSGAVRVLIPEPGEPLVLPDTLGLDSLPEMARLEVQQVDSPGVAGPAQQVSDRPGAWNVMVRLQGQVKRLANLSVLTPVPAELAENGRIGQYLIGEWPTRGELPSNLRTPEYEAPRGLIAVTPENRDLPISEHLVLGDFLTKGQEDVWPKYVALSPRILDKLELTFQELERMGHPVENVGIISGFRTPHYNAYGGSTSGRGGFSRHMYGDAMDFYIDNDNNSAMDDLNGDGQVNREDAEVIAEAADRVEEQYPEYVGGIGIYGVNPGAHSGFVHVDTRGYRARW